MMAAQVERQYDEYERMATEALMNRQAQNAKRVKHSQLFKRPVDGDIAKDKMKDAKERMKQRMEQLSRYEEFRGKLNTDRKEVDDERYTR